MSDKQFLLPSPDFVNKIFDSSLLPSLWVIILSNSTALGIYLWMISQLKNFKTRLGNEVEFACLMSTFTARALKSILQLQVEMRLELTLFWYNPSCFIIYLPILMHYAWVTLTHYAWVTLMHYAWVTLKHYVWVSHLWTKDINLMHQGQFLTPDSQIQTNCSLTHDKY